MVPGDGMSIGFARLIPHFAWDRLRRPVCGAPSAPLTPNLRFASTPADNHLKSTLNGCFSKWCLGTESNRRHRDFQSLALPTELSRRMSLDYTYFSTEVKNFFEKTGPIVDFMPLTGRLRQRERCL